MDQLLKKYSCCINFLQNKEEKLILFSCPATPLKSISQLQEPFQEKLYHLKIFLSFPAFRVARFK